ncbi:unnamed protein product, partial [Ixodes hexagonus]
MSRRKQAKPRALKRKPVTVESLADQFSKEILPPAGYQECGNDPSPVCAPV